MNILIKPVFTFLLLLTAANGIAQILAPKWETCLGGTEWDEATNIVMTSDSTYWIVASTKSNDGEISFNHGAYDIWVLHLDKSGALISEKTFGGSFAEGANAQIKSINDSVFYIASFGYSIDGDISNNPWPGPPVNCNLWVLKINMQGEILWETMAGGSRDDELQNMIITNDGGLLLLGDNRSYDGDVTDHHGLYDMWMLKIDSSGQKKWSLSLGGSGHDLSGSVIQTSDGGYLVGGSTDGAGGGNYDTTCNHHYPGWFPDAWIIKLDSALNIQWQQCYGGYYYDGANNMIELSDGYIVLGCTNSNDGDVSGLHGAPGDGQPYDIWVFKIDKTGNLLWQKCLGGTYDEWARNIFPTSDGGFMIVGSTESNDGDVEGFHGEIPGYSLHDIWFVKIDSMGNPVWQYCYGGELDEMIYRGVWQKNDWDYTLAIATGTPEWKCYPSNPPNSYNLYDVRVVELYDSTVGINETTANTIDVNLYPNPACSQLTVELKNYNTLHNATLELISINGKSVLTKTLTASKTQLKTSNLNNGIYLLKIEMDKGILTRKIIVEH